jgi:DNA polymerase-1
MITVISKSTEPRYQRCYNGVRLLPERSGLFPKNVYKIDAGAMPMIKRMSQRGLQIDLDHFAGMSTKLGGDMEICKDAIRDLTGYYINPGSGDQVADLLFKKMGLKQAKPKMTDSGSRESVEDEVLTAIQHEHPVVGKILEYKEYEKLKGTYVDPMPGLAKRIRRGLSSVWRMFPNFRNTAVPSGRLSCYDPNLLAMPARTERGRMVRCGFITDPDWVYLSVDLSQIEPRMAAHRSQDVNLCNVYINEEDIYSDFAISAFRIPDKRYRDDTGWHYPGVDKMDHRRPSKTCVLASIYDVTAGGLQEQMPVICAGCNRPAVCSKCDEGKAHNVPQDCFAHNCAKFRPLWIENKCQDLINAFYMRYSGLLRMRLDDHKYMRSTSMICDCWGRGQHITAARSVLEWVVMGALREGSNLPMQGGAQGVIKLAMAAIDDDLVKCNYYGNVCYPLLQIHDELLFEVHKDYVEDVMAVCMYRMENAVRLRVPLVASAVTADDWGSLPK